MRYTVGVTQYNNFNITQYVKYQKCFRSKQCNKWTYLYLYISNIGVYYPKYWSVISRKLLGNESFIHVFTHWYLHWFPSNVKLQYWKTFLKLVFYLMCFVFSQIVSSRFCWSTWSIKHLFKIYQIKKPNQIKPNPKNCQYIIYMYIYIAM